MTDAKQVPARMIGARARGFGGIPLAPDSLGARAHRGKSARQPPWLCRRPRRGGRICCGRTGGTTGETHPWRWTRRYLMHTAMTLQR
jgi:hypothetical protein